MASVLELVLFVAADSPDSTVAIANLEALFPTPGRAGVQIEIVDVRKHPARAARHAILVTPTLLKIAPQPPCRVIGNLKNGQALLRLLGVPEITSVEA